MGSGEVETALEGFALVADPMLNKGTAFSETERDVFRLHGLLPPHVGKLEQQAARRLKALRGYQSNFERYAFLRELQDTIRELALERGMDPAELDRLLDPAAMTEPGLGSGGGGG